MNNMIKRSEEFLMDKRIQDLFNNKSRNEDNIRYGTTIFANDVKCFRSQPLQVCIYIFLWVYINICMYVFVCEYSYSHLYMCQYLYFIAVYSWEENNIHYM
jgi:hypothetical protein